jgi:AraC-like DNA-binding protein
LAYRDPNSFYRAFQDWTGMTPAQARGLETV